MRRLKIGVELPTLYHRVALPVLAVAICSSAHIQITSLPNR